MKKHGRVYIITNNKKSVLYTGFTTDMLGRMQKHVDEYYKGFSSKYGCKYLIDYEEFDSILDPIDREKEIKGWTRAQKEALINAINPDWISLNDKFL
ncbi:MAG: GIY-YIG nuclease family protein [Flavobacteriales bacterium]|nr:GIY-YIG nuclease family protein [Flavobacteriales bacterium]